MNDKTPPEQKPLDVTQMTPWFPKGTHPVRIGYYERCFTDGILMNYWNGRCWLQDKDGEPHWRNWKDYPQWRGLEVNPYAFRAHRDRQSFEQWLPTVKSSHPNIERVGLSGDGDYRDRAIQDLWHAWKSGQYSPYRARA